MAALVLPQLMFEFAGRYPGISIETSGTSTALDLNRRAAEMAIRATRKAPEFALGRGIGGFRFGVYAARDRAEALSQTPLAERAWVLLAGVESWLVSGIWRNETEAREGIVVSSPSILSVVNLTVLPYDLGEVDDRLVRLQTIDELDLELGVLTRPNFEHTARVKVRMNHLYEQLEALRETFET